MTTMTAKRKTVKKQLRIRPEFLPDSARYATIDDREYVMIPVDDFREWFEDIEDRVIVEERKKFDDGERIPLTSIGNGVRPGKARK